MFGKFIRFIKNLGQLQVLFAKVTLSLKNFHKGNIVCPNFCRCFRQRHHPYFHIVIELTDLKQKESSLVSGNRPSENFLSLTRPHSRMCIRIHNFNSKNKQNSRKKNKKKKRRKENISEKSIKNEICGHPGDHFSRHLHFRKQEYLFFFGLKG